MDKVPTRIVDKNGRETTVYRKIENYRDQVKADGLRRTVPSMAPKMTHGYTEIARGADKISEPYEIDSKHFGVTAKILGVNTAYVLKGDINDLENPNNKIIGRTEIDSGSVYIGSRLKGGTYCGSMGTFGDSATAEDYLIEQSE